MNNQLINLQVPVDTVQLAPMSLWGFCRGRKTIVKMCFPSIRSGELVRLGRKLKENDHRHSVWLTFTLHDWKWRRSRSCSLVLLLIWTAITRNYQVWAAGEEVSYCTCWSGICWIRCSLLRFSRKQQWRRMTFCHLLHVKWVIPRI